MPTRGVFAESQINITLLASSWPLIWCFCRRT